MNRFGDDDDDDGADDRPKFGPGGRHGQVEHYLRDLDVWRRRAAGSGRLVVWGAAALVLVLLGFMTLYQVQPEEVGVVRPVRQIHPDDGARPAREDAVRRAGVQDSRSSASSRRSSAFAPPRPPSAAPSAQADFNAEAMMLTGDLNVAVVEWIVQYRSRGSRTCYLFKVRNITETFRAMNEAVMRQVVGDRTVTEVLTVGRQAIETRVGRAAARAHPAVRDGDHASSRSCCRT